MFKINDFITLRLENNDTYIYIKEDLFRQCKFLLLNRIHLDEIKGLLEDFRSIDEEIEDLDQSLEEEEYYENIDPETEFWAHCSNLQVWAENDYDSRLLHRNLSFPLLKELTKRGDPLAKFKFKEEIIKRLETGVSSVINYLFENNYVQYLSKDELYYAILEPEDAETLLELEHLTQRDYGRIENFEILRSIGNNKYNVHFAIKNKRITELELFFDGEFTFPDFITHLKNLKTLYIHIGEFVESLSEPMIEIKNIEELRIFSYGETTLFNSFEIFPNLKRIYIHGGSFDTTPESITTLKDLQLLLINRTSLRYLPESIDNLKFLEILNLRQCNLWSLPKTITKLKKIKKLEINSDLLDGKIEKWLLSLDLFQTSVYTTSKNKYLIIEKKVQD